MKSRALLVGAALAVLTLPASAQDKTFNLRTLALGAGHPPVAKSDGRMGRFG